MPASACGDAFLFLKNDFNFLRSRVDFLFSSSANGPCWSHFSVDGEGKNVSGVDAVSTHALLSRTLGDGGATPTGLSHIEINPSELYFLPDLSSVYSLQTFFSFWVMGLQLVLAIFGGVLGLPVTSVPRDCFEQVVAPSCRATHAQASSTFGVSPEKDGLARVKGDFNRFSVKILARPNDSSLPGTT